MRRVTRGALLCVVGALVALALAAVPASATTAGAGCTLLGSASVTGPNGGVEYDDNKGSYSFSSLTFTCAGSWTGASTGVGSGVDVVTIGASSSGNYDNIACGTGFAADDNPAIVSATGVNTDTTGVNILKAGNFAYNLAFASGQGALDWETGREATGGGVPNPRQDPTIKDPVGGGVISIQPWPAVETGVFPKGIFPNGGPGADKACTNGFVVEGVIAGALDG